MLIKMECRFFYNEPDKLPDISLRILTFIFYFVFRVCILEIQINNAWLHIEIAAEKV